MDARSLASRDLRLPESDIALRLQFQRGRSRVRRSSRRIGLRLRLILLILALFAVFFTGVQKAYMLALTSRALTVKSVTLSGATDKTEAAVRGIAEERLSVSLVLLDTNRLKADLEALSWVKEADAAKVWPSRLRVVIRERTPMALLKQDELYLVDEEGVRLETVDPASAPDLPLLTDAGLFDQDYAQKVESARECLSGLPAKLKKNVAVLDLSFPGRVDLQLKDSPVRVFLTADQSALSLTYFERKVADWESRFGRLDYVDLTVPGRAYLGPAKGSDRASLPRTGSEKEIL
jgi:cell division septal protein FtsQ